MRSVAAGHWKLTTTNLEQSSILIIAISWSSYRYMRSCWRTQHLPLGSFGIYLKQIWKVKKLDKWVPHELTANQKTYCFEVSSSHILHNNNKSFLNWIVMCNEKWIVTWWPVMTSTVAGSRSSKALEKDKLAPKKVMVTVWCSAACLIHYSFLNPGEIIPSEKYAQQINEKHQKLQCLQLALVTRKGSILHTNTQPHVLQPMLQKLNWGMKFCFIHPIPLTSCQPTTTSSIISTTFCRENVSTTNKRQNMLSKSAPNPEAWIFMLQE